VRLAEKARLVFEGPTEIRAAAGRLTIDVPDSVLLGVSTAHGLVVTRHSEVVIDVLATRTEVEVRRGDALVRRPKGGKQILGVGTKLSLLPE
jgi:hypothetical protein